MGGKRRRGRKNKARNVACQIDRAKCAPARPGGHANEPRGLELPNRTDGAKPPRMEVQASGRILTIANQKGGVGKTTTAVNLAASLAAAERRTLLVDVDPQGNAGSALGIRRDESEQSIYEVLVDGVPMASAVRKTELKFLDLVPASRHLVGAELELAELDARESRLKRAVDEVARDYEYVVIDCPPSLGLLTLNGLVAAQGVVIPLQCEYYALEGLADVLKTIELVRSSANPALTVDGIVLTMFSPNNLANQVADEIRRTFADQVFKTVIPRNVRLSEAPSHGKPILLYDVTSKGCQSYLELAREVAGRFGQVGGIA
jgi:chromosome partitioning protein